MLPEQGVAGESFRIDIGPLRARWRQIGFGLLWLFLMVVSTAFSLRQTRLDCVRQLGQAARCVLTESPPLPRVSRYAPGAIGAITVVQKSRSKGGTYWDVMMLDSRGAEQRVASYNAQPFAEALAARLRAFLADPQAPRFSFVPSRPSRAFLYLACGIGLSLVLFWHAFRDAGHLLVDIDRVHGELRVRRRLFGVPLGKLARYPLAELRDIELEHGRVRDAFAARGQLPEPGARLAVVRHSGHRFPLTPIFLPSPRQFETGLELLRAELGFATPESPKSPQASAEAQEPPSERAPTIAAKRTPHSRAWLIGLGVTLIAVAASAIVSWRSATSEAQLEIRAEYRCQFDGIDILPGGVMSMSLAPGRYDIHVFDTAAVGGWQTQRYSLRAGESKLVICRPH